MVYEPRKLRSYEEGIIRPSRVDDSVRFSYTRPLTIVEFLNIFSKELEKKQLEKIIEAYFPDDSFLRKEPAVVSALSYGIKDFDELEGKNIFDVFQLFDTLAMTYQNEKSEGSLDELLRLDQESLFISGGDCKTRAVFLINPLRSYKFPCRLVRGYEENEGAHMWIEINYDGLWTPFEPYVGINLSSNNEAVRYYLEYFSLDFSKP